MKYTVNRGSVEIGQFELKDIQALMNAGVILPTDYFWFQGMSEWKPVSSLFAPAPGSAQQAMPPAVRADNPPSIVVTKEMGPSCPSCHSSDVIKAHAAYEATLQQHSLSAGTSGGFRLWAGGETINKVGIKCAPPTKPEKTTPFILARALAVIAGLFSFGFGMSALSMVISKGLGEGIGPLLLSIFAGVACFYCVRAWRNREAEIEADFQRQLRQHKAALADYVRTWRCNKCGIMYQD